MDNCPIFILEWDEPCFLDLRVIEMGLMDYIGILSDEFKR
jgi:hypothetical protein